MHACFLQEREDEAARELKAKDGRIRELESQCSGSRILANQLKELQVCGFIAVTLNRRVRVYVP